MHALRSALDHLVWQLVILEGGTPDWRTQFPIYDDAAKFDQAVRFPRGRRVSPLHDIRPDGDIWALIEDAQPYRCPDPRQHYLSGLGKLSNIDKHRTLHATIPLHSRESLWSAIGWNPAAQLMEHVWSNPELSHEHEAEVLRLQFSQAGLDPQVHVKGKIGIEPTFGDGETFQISVGGIYQLPNWIRQLAEQFVRFF